jgi:hypothetical protein
LRLKKKKFRGLKGGFERPGSLASLVGLLDG